MYADDTHLTFASNDVEHLEENIHDDLTKITEWLTANNPTLSTLNKSKTEFMLIGSMQRLNIFNRLPSTESTTESCSPYFDLFFIWYQCGWSLC